MPDHQERVGETQKITEEVFFCFNVQNIKLNFTTENLYLDIQYFDSTGISCAFLHAGALRLLPFSSPQIQNHLTSSPKRTPNSHSLAFLGFLKKQNREALMASKFKASDDGQNFFQLQPILAHEERHILQCSFLPVFLSVQDLHKTTTRQIQEERQFRGEMKAARGGGGR